MQRKMFTECFCSIEKGTWLQGGSLDKLINQRCPKTLLVHRNKDKGIIDDFRHGKRQPPIVVDSGSAAM
jgi:Zn-finger nucleic acid-binding protein